MAVEKVFAMMPNGVIRRVHTNTNTGRAWFVVHKNGKQVSMSGSLVNKQFFIPFKEEDYDWLKNDFKIQRISQGPISDEEDRVARTRASERRFRLKQCLEYAQPT